MYNTLFMHPPILGYFTLHINQFTIRVSPQLIYKVGKFIWEIFKKFNFCNICCRVKDLLEQMVVFNLCINITTASEQKISFGFRFNITQSAYPVHPQYILMSTKFHLQRESTTSQLTQVTPFVLKQVCS